MTPDATRACDEWCDERGLGPQECGAEYILAKDAFLAGYSYILSELWNERISGAQVYYEQRRVMEQLQERVAKLEEAAKH